MACSAIDHVHPVSRTASVGQSAADVLGWHGWKDRDAMSLTEDDHGDVDRTKHSELVRLLEEAVLALWFGRSEDMCGYGCRALIDRVLSECQEN